MNAEQIKSSLNVFCKNVSFQVCTPSTYLKYKQISIVNTTEYPGKHWQLVVKIKNKRIYYDSFGEPASKFIKSLNYDTENCVKHQLDVSSTCGEFCIFVAYYLVKGYPFCYVMKLFKTNLEHNEYKVKTFYGKRFQTLR